MTKSFQMFKCPECGQAVVFDQVPNARLKKEFMDANAINGWTTFDQYVAYERTHECKSCRLYTKTFQMREHDLDDLFSEVRRLRRFKDEIRNALNQLSPVAVLAE